MNAPSPLRVLLLVLLAAIRFSLPAGAASSAAPPTAQTAPPPSAPARRSTEDLEKLVAPIALYPDPLIATILPASVYPLEIVQAARFVANTNNLPTLDQQPWDENVRAVAKIPEVIKKLNDDLPWTMELGEAFLAQDKDVMDAIQSLRAKARQVGTLQTTPQQVVTVTNTVVEKSVEQRVVVVTNTVVQIQPANPQVVYVPTYNPSAVYYPPPPTYVGPPPVVSFAAGVAVGAIIANNCDWHHGGCYRGDVNIDIDRNVNVNRNANVSSSATGRGQKWQPDQARMSRSGPPSASATSRTARGWSPATSAASPAMGGARPTIASRPTPPTGGTRPSPSPTASPSVSNRSASPGNAFAGASNGNQARQSSARGASSRSAGGGARAGRR